MSHSDGRATGASRTAGSHHFASPSLRCGPTKSLPLPPLRGRPSGRSLTRRPHAHPSCSCRQRQTSGGYYGFNCSAQFELGSLLCRAGCCRASSAATASSISTSWRIVSLDTSLWTRATTTRSRHTLQRALCIRCMGQYSMSFDRKSRAGTGSGSCPFSWSPGLNFCQNRWLDNSAF